MGLGENHPSKGVGFPCYMKRLYTLLSVFSLRFFSVALSQSFHGATGVLDAADIVVTGMLFWVNGSHPSRHGCGAVYIRA